MEQGQGCGRERKEAKELKVIEEVEQTGLGE